jgi:hypothetical protein
MGSNFVCYFQEETNMAYFALHMPEVGSELHAIQADGWQAQLRLCWVRGMRPAEL